MIAPEQHFVSASLYVGDLHPDVSETMLFEVFNAIGPVASIRVCRESGSRKSLRYAYVNYHSVNDAERALDILNYTPIKGTPCRIMWSHRDPSLRQSGAGNIFVKNLDKMIDNKALYDTFSLFGNILSCKVATDEYGRSKGYGFVHYESEESGRAAIEKVNNMQIESKIVYVGPFKRRVERKDDREIIFTNVYVKHFSPEWTEETLRNVFSPFGEITSLVISSDSLNRRFGFVNFKNPSSAKACVAALHGKKITATGVCMDETTKSLKGTPNDQRIENSENKPENNDMTLRGEKVENNEVQSKEESQQETSPKEESQKIQQEEPEEKKDINTSVKDENTLYVQRAMSKAERKNLFKRMAVANNQKQKQTGLNLFVKNLDPQVTDDMLREAFSKFGTITSAKVMRDDAKNSKGFGFVSFAFSDEATNAVTAMHLSFFHGKPLYVGLAEKRDHRAARLKQRFKVSNHTGGRLRSYGAANANAMTPLVMGQTGEILQPQILPFHNTSAAPIYYNPGTVSTLQQPALQKGIRSPAPPASYVGNPHQMVSGTAMWRQHDITTNRQPFSASANANNTVSAPSGNYPTYPLGQGGGTNFSGVSTANQNFIFTPQARNRQGFPVTMTGAATTVPSVSHVASGGSQTDVAKLLRTPNRALSAQSLANTHPQLQKQLLGERLFPLVQKRQPDLAGKITGMMLEMDNAELLSLLDSDAKLDAKVNEALGVLRQHRQGVPILSSTQRTPPQSTGFPIQAAVVPNSSFMNSTTEISNN